MGKIQTYSTANAPISGSDKLIGTDTANNNATKNFTVSEIQGFIQPYAVYTALMNQLGTVPPVATILQNTLGFTPSWNYFEPGKYGFNFPSTPEYDKIAIFIGGTPVGETNGYVLNSDYNVIIGNFTNDGTLLNTPIEIRVYNS